MTSAQLVPAYHLAKQNGVKACIYGPPGSAKTPLLDTLGLGGYNPVVMVTEPAYGSMKHSQIACYPAYTSQAIKEFYQWAVGSTEAKQFGAMCIDSASEMAEIFLRQAEGGTTKGGNANRGKQAYGEMSREVREIINGLYFSPGLNLVVLAKEGVDDFSQKRPWFPGQDLFTFMPHRFDWIGHSELQQQKRVLRNLNGLDCMVRERTGRLAEIEDFNLAAAFNKLLAQ